MPAFLFASRLSKKYATVKNQLLILPSFTYILELLISLYYPYA
jgi:hypothetical protein